MKKTFDLVKLKIEFIFLEQRDEIRRRRIAALTRQNSDDLDLD